MAFVFSKTTPSTGAVAMYEFKELLKTAGWTVLSSSDGTTYNASADQITTGAAGAGGMANNSAWFRLQSPAGAGSQQFTIQRGTGNTLWRFKRSRTAGFSGGSPSATQTPSATDEFVFGGAGTDASPTFATYFSPDGGLYRWYIGADNASPYGFWAGAFPNGGGNPQASFCLDPIIGGESTDADKYVMHWAVTGNNGYLQTSLNAESGAGTTNRIFSSIISTSPGSTYDNFMAATFNAPGGTVVVPNAVPTNPITAKDDAFPLLFMRRASIANPGFKGISTVMRWTGVNRSTGDTLTVSTTRDRIIYGHVSLPWDGSVPVV